MDGVYSSDKCSVFNSFFGPNVLGCKAFCHEKSVGVEIFWSLFFLRRDRLLYWAVWLFDAITGKFLQTQLTAASTLVIIVGFAIKSEDFCPAKALQVVCSVDDGPKTDWQVARVKRGANAGASWEPI